MLDYNFELVSQKTAESVDLISISGPTVGSRYVLSVKWEEKSSKLTKFWAQKKISLCHSSHKSRTLGFRQKILAGKEADKRWDIIRRWLCNISIYRLSCAFVQMSSWARNSVYTCIKKNDFFRNRKDSRLPVFTI